MDPKSRKAKVSIDQQIVENNIYGIGGHVSTHRDLRVSGASLRRVDSHLDTVEDHTAHDDTEISYRAVMRFRCGTAHPYDRACKSHEQDAEENRGYNDKDDGSAEDPVGFLRLLLSAASGNQSGDCHIQGKEQRQPYKFGLRREADGGHGVGAKRTYHQRVHQSCKSGKERLYNGRPCHIEGDTDIVPVVLWLFFLRCDRSCHDYFPACSSKYLAANKKFLELTM